MALPRTTKAWTVEPGSNAFKFHHDLPLPALGAFDVLVKIEGVSLNARDLQIKEGIYPFPITPGVVACSDGAGTIIAIGKSVSRHKINDKVLTLFNRAHQGGPLDEHAKNSGLGAAVDGALREYGVFNENAVVAAPGRLNAVESSTLTCAGSTAWNALFGMPGHALKAGEWVLTQGTGGVSLFALQLAKAAGARVVATTGSDGKKALLERLGADVVLNYRDVPAWGAVAKAATTGGKGFQHVVEVAGPSSMQQSLDAVGINGVISIIGFVGGANAGAQAEPSFLGVLMALCHVRGILVGSRVQLEELCAAVDANEKLRPVVDRVFEGIESVEEAMEYFAGGQHTGKVCIRL